MSNDDDDFDFSDHDLDDLPANTIQQFEAAAIRATQQQTPHAAPESDYGLEDADEVVNLDDEDGFGHGQGQQRAHDPYDTYDAYDAYEEGTTIDESNNHEYAVVEPPRQSQADPDQLLSRIKKLEQERAREKRDADNLKTKLQTKAGEADTLRRRHDAEQRRHERQLADQQQFHGDEMAKLRAEIERLRREKEQATTNNMFHQHDVREAGMAPRTRKPMTARPKAAAALSPAGTPKKKRGPLGDGFDDSDVVMASPSRTRERPKTATPSLAGKRKRNVVDASPIPLQLSEPRSQPQEKDVEFVQGDAQIDAALLDYFRNDDKRFDLLHRLMAHVSPNGTDRVLEALAQHSFPSNISKRLSSIFYDALSAKAFSDVHALALDICLALCDLWAQCLVERYYTPVNTLLDALHFILASSRCETACEIKSRFVPLMIDSIDLVANPLSKAAKAGQDAITTLYASGHRTITAQIDVLECLDILHLIATSCVGLQGTHTTELWSSIPSDFAIMLLNKEQPIAQIALMLQILSTSALPTSIGPITDSESQSDSQATREDALIGRLTNLLTEVPVIDPDPCPPNTEGEAENQKQEKEELNETDLLTLHHHIILLLTTLSLPQHGSTRLATSKILTGRFLKYLDRLLHSLYTRPLSPSHSITIRSINATMRLLSHLVATNPGFDVKSKLVNTLGGTHAYLVSLTRLAFSEGLVLEGGIEEDVVDAAHAVLDEGLSLEEGEAFGGVFSGVSAV